MLPTFVIGLREGVEASLIIGIIAAFLATRGRLEALRWVWIGAGSAAAICLAIGVGLRAVEGTLDQQAQERLETVVALVAVAMVSYMILWMRRNARHLKGDIETHLDFDTRFDFLAFQTGDALFEQLTVEFKAHRGDVAALLCAEQIACATDFQIAHGDLKAAAQGRVLLDGAKPAPDISQ